MTERERNRMNQGYEDEGRRFERNQAADRGRDRPDYPDSRRQRGESRNQSDERGYQRGYERGYGRLGDAYDYDSQGRMRNAGWRDEDDWSYGEQGRMSDYGRQSGGMGLGGQGWMGNAPGPHQGRGPKGYQRSDERIQEDVCEELTRHSHIDASNIEVSVSGGEVTLEGTVDSRQAKRMAEDCCDTISGVREVHNRLRIARSS